jgi:hypothetical protein
MRKYFILLILSVFFAFVTYYLLQTLNPFDTAKIAQLAESQNIAVVEELKEVEIELIQKGLILEYLDLRHLIIILLVGSLSVISGFTFVHLVVEKVVFRKFYQQPSTYTAVRRGAFLCLAIITAILYRLYAAEAYLTFVTWILLFVMEVIITRVLAKPHEETKNQKSETIKQEDSNQKSET